MERSVPPFPNLLKFFPLHGKCWPEVKKCPTLGTKRSTSMCLEESGGALLDPLGLMVFESSL